MSVLPAESIVPIEREPADDVVAMFQRFATDPNADVEKVERLIALLERNQAKKAEMAFNSAMSEAQKEMRPVAADANNPQTRSRYASYAALDTALRSVYTKHGFALSFNTGDAPLEGWVRVMCDVSHAGGCVKSYRVDMPADGKGAKGGDVMTKTHAVGSAMSYGMRYLLKLIFNVAVGEDDDDGNKAAQAVAVKTPQGFEDWWTDIQSVADNGTDALSKAWTASKPEYRTHVFAAFKGEWEGLKKRAAKVKA